jgi:hypothetical protein
LTGSQSYDFRLKTTTSALYVHSRRF